MLLHPEITDSVSVTTPNNENLDLNIDEISISKIPSYIGKSIKDTKIRDMYDLIIVCAIKSDKNSFVVFSEWYPMASTEDWQLYLDDEPIKLERVNYALRGAFLPAGSYKIEMRFNPVIVAKAEIGHWIGHTLLVFLFIFYVLNAIKPKET